MSRQPTAFCTISAANYLPQVLALFASTQRIEPEIPLYVLVVDAERVKLHELPEGLHQVAFDLVIPEQVERHTLATIYDVVELSTAVKPRFMELLLDRYDHVVYLDPDMWLMSPMSELGPLLDQHGVVLTPHFLEEIRPGERLLGDGSTLAISEVHCLTVGIHNLGFCAVGQDGRPFLDWWWSHLRRECLIYPLLGMFTDQKWTDVGASLHQAHSLRHYGYNIANHNLQERWLERDSDGLFVRSNGDRVRLLHFSGFDPLRPEAISSRQNEDLGGRDLASPAYLAESQVYADAVLGARAMLGPLPAYGWQRDSSGRTLNQRTRRTYRSDLITGRELPSAFNSSQAQAFSDWRRRSSLRKLANIALDASLAAKYAFPDTFAKFREATPNGFMAARQKLLRAGSVRR